MALALAIMYTIALLAVPLAGEAQQTGKVHHIGFLASGASPAHRQQLDALREGLHKLGPRAHYSAVSASAGRSRDRVIPAWCQENSMTENNAQVSESTVRVYYRQG